MNIINFSKTKNVNIFRAIKEFRKRTLIVCFVIVLSIPLENPVVESCAYYSLDQDLDEISLPHYAYGFVTLGNGIDELSELYLNHECNTCAACKNLSCPSRKSPLQELPHTYDAMQIFHIK